MLNQYAMAASLACATGSDHDGKSASSTAGFGVWHRQDRPGRPSIRFGGFWSADKAALPADPLDNTARSVRQRKIDVDLRDDLHRLIVQESGPIEPLFHGFHRGGRQSRM